MGRVGLVHHLGSFLDEIIVILGHVVGFARSLLSVVEFDRTSEHGLANRFPVSKTNGLATLLLVEFPVQIFVLLLLVVDCP